MPENSGHFSGLFVELGLIIAGLAVLARLAKRYGISAIPLYLLAGLAFGKGGLTPLHVSEQFTRIGSEIGVLLLLFMLGLEYTGEELGRSLKSGIAAGAIDFALIFGNHRASSRRIEALRQPRNACAALHPGTGRSRHGGVSAGRGGSVGGRNSIPHGSVRVDRIARGRGGAVCGDSLWTVHQRDRGPRVGRDCSPN